MKYYNFFEEQQLSLSKITDETSCSTLKEPSTFLNGPLCHRAKTTHTFSFILYAELNRIGVFYVTITHERFKNVFYGYDYTTFCIIHSNDRLILNKRYIIYGKVTKIKQYFIEALNTEPFIAKDMAYMLL